MIFKDKYKGVALFGIFILAHNPNKRFIIQKNKNPEIASMLVIPRAWLSWLEGKDVGGAILGKREKSRIL